MSAATAYRDAACGRVLAMLSHGQDAPEQSLQKLTDALSSHGDVAPRIMRVPSMRPETCVVMIFLGILVACLTMHLWPSDLTERGAGSAGDHDGPDA